MKKKAVLAGLTAALLAGSVAVFAPQAQAADTDDLILNADFESDKTVGWDITGDRGAVSISEKPGDIKGTASLHYWDNKAFHFTCQQTLEEVPDGVYNITVDTMGGGGENSMTLFAETNGERQTAAIKDTGWNIWQTWTLENVEVKGGTVTIGVDVDANSGNWGSIDNFTITPAE